VAWGTTIPAIPKVFLHNVCKFYKFLIGNKARNRGTCNYYSVQTGIVNKAVGYLMLAVCHGRIVERSAFINNKVAVIFFCGLFGHKVNQIGIAYIYVVNQKTIVLRFFIRLLLKIYILCI